MEGDSKKRAAGSEIVLQFDLENPYMHKYFIRFVTSSIYLSANCMYTNGANAKCEQVHKSDSLEQFLAVSEKLSDAMIVLLFNCLLSSISF